MTDAELRDADRAAAPAVLGELLGRLTWSGEQLRAEQTTGLRRLVAVAKERSPWHRERLRHVEPAQLTLSDLASLPTMTKDDLMTDFDEIVTDRRLTRALAESHLATLEGDRYLLEEYHVLASGGSSGRRGIFVFDRTAWCLYFASYMRFMLTMVAGMPPPSRPPVMASVAADKPTHATMAVGLTFLDPTSPRLAASWPLERLVAALNDAQPDMLMGYASVVTRLAREAAAGRLRIKPGMVSATSEPLSPEMRATIEAAWGVPVFNGFGSTEGLMGGSCSARRGIHFSTDLVLVEPVDAAGRAVPPGTRSDKAYITVLFNAVQPMIRYELTDPLTVLDGSCPCGTTLLRVDDIEGRSDDAFTYGGGVVMHPFALRSVLGRTSEVIEYQVRQTARGVDVSIVCEAAPDTAAIEHDLRAALAKAGVAAPEARVTVVEALPRLGIGKLRRFVPR
jgi:phenylacetate-coenzyme A ligase PaaK-like adenylate-forming protein